MNPRLVYLGKSISATIYIIITIIKTFGETPCCIINIVLKMYGNPKSLAYFFTCTRAFIATYTKAMLPSILNSQTCFFSVSHITKPFSATFIYGIYLNNQTYYVSKTPGMNDCEQLNCMNTLEPAQLDEICYVLTQIETSHKKHPTMEWINQEIFKILGLLKSPLFLA